jgi:hypothetical protein
MAPEYYEIRVLVRHPTLRVEALSELFGEEPDYSANAGDKGHPQQSSWSRVSHTHGERTFFSEVKHVVEWLSGKGNLVHEIRQAGGSVEIIVQLPGDTNIGDSMPPDLLVDIGSLGASLGVEIFPRMRRVGHEP